MGSSAINFTGLVLTTLMAANEVAKACCRRHQSPRPELPVHSSASRTLLSCAGTTDMSPSMLSVPWACVMSAARCGQLVVRQAGLCTRKAQCCAPQPTSDIVVHAHQQIGGPQTVMPQALHACSILCFMHKMLAAEFQMLQTTQLHGQCHITHAGKSRSAGLRTSADAC